MYVFGVATPPPLYQLISALTFSPPTFNPSGKSTSMMNPSDTWSKSKSQSDKLFSVHLTKKRTFIPENLGLTVTMWQLFLLEFRPNLAETFFGPKKFLSLLASPSCYICPRQTYSPPWSCSSLLGRLQLWHLIPHVQLVHFRQIRPLGRP